MNGVRFFGENSLRQTIRLTPDRGRSEEALRRRGVCLEQDTGPGATRHVAAEGTELLDDPSVLPAGLAERARTLLARPLHGVDTGVLEGLSAFAARTGTTLTWACHEQHVIVGGTVRPRADVRAIATVEVELPGAGSEVVPWPAPGAGTERGTPSRGRALDDALELLRARRALPARGLPDPVPDLVMLPGRAGAFFHELLGHPREGDVAASGTSYLSGLEGERLAPVWLDADDGAVHTDHGFRARFDDQGVPCARTPLLRSGKLGEPLTDLATARLTGSAPRGHGRRLDYRFAALPRMTHTRVTCSSPEAVPDGEWIAPLGLSLEMMGIASGEFVFVAEHPLLYRGRTPVARLPRLRLTGEGARTLTGLRPGPGAVRGYTRASRGCGKLGQFPLIVSFANSGLRLPRGLVEVVPDA